MRHGGYIIIDLQGKELLDGVGMVVDGIYDKVEGTSKAILVSGFNFEGVEYKDTFVAFSVVGSAFVGKIYEKEIKIEDTDVVTITDV